MDAYLTGLERRARRRHRPRSTIQSVASFFVSRVDTEVDKRLEAIGSDRHSRCAARPRSPTPGSRTARSRRSSTSDRWRRLLEEGANRQRPLWASTGVKNPDYADTLYVTDLVVADTVNTMPEKTLEAFADHGEVLGDQVTGQGSGDAQQAFDRLTEVGVDFDDVLVVLETEGVDKFKKSWDELVETVQGQMDQDGSGVTDARGRLGDLAAAYAPDLRASFADDPGRAARLTFEAADLTVDLSKGLVDDEIMAALLSLAQESGVAERRDAMFRGEHINVTEDRAVLHTALRLPPDATLEVDGQDVVADVHEVLERVYAFAERVRSGAWTGATGERIRTVVNIGIGGSDLGPVMAYEALEPYRQDGLECRFISNIDPTDAGTSLKGLDPATTLFIVASKTFGTLETLTNARLCKAWLLEGLSPPTRPSTSRAPSPSTSSPCPPRSTRSRTSASTRTTRSASGTGSAGATRWARRSAPRSWSPSGPSGSPSSWRACTRWTSTSGPPSRPATCRS